MHSNLAFRKPGKTYFNCPLSSPLPYLYSTEGGEPEANHFPLLTAGEAVGSSSHRRPLRWRERRGTPDLRPRRVNRCGLGVRAADGSVATNKVLAFLILCQGVRACLPGDGVGAAMARSRRYFVPPDLLLLWWIGSGSSWESGGKRLGFGRRRAPASSRGVLHWSGWRGLKDVTPAFFLDVFDGRLFVPKLPVPHGINQSSSQMEVCLCWNRAQRSGDIYGCFFVGRVQESKAN
jgi:hypothetical protein